MEDSIPTVLEKAEFIMLGDLETSLGKGTVFCFQILVPYALHMHVMLKLFSSALNNWTLKIHS